VHHPIADLILCFAIGALFFACLFTLIKCAVYDGISDALKDARLDLEESEK